MSYADANAAASARVAAAVGGGEVSWHLRENLHICVCVCCVCMSLCKQSHSSEEEGLLGSWAFEAPSRGSREQVLPKGCEAKVRV